MKILKKILASLLLILVLIIGLSYVFDVDYLLKAVRTIYFKGHTTAFLDDYHAFDNRVIQKSDHPEPWPNHADYNHEKITPRLQKTIDSLGAIAFVIIKNDSVWHESYFDGYGDDSKTNSFSMAKSIVSAAMGKAIQEGKIKSLDQKVIDFFPDLKGEFASEVTVGDLSSMSSGMDWDEAYYSPLSITTRAYFDDSLDELMLSLPIKNEPGKSYKYLSGNTQLLAMLVTKAVGKDLSTYVSESFWKPMGAEHDALWQTDNENGMEKAYCCIASNAKDFARFGKLFKQKGNWNGKQILDTAFVEKSVKPRFPDSPEYGYGWWLSNHLGKNIFYMRGHLGQNVIVIPEDDLIIVRLGHQHGLPKENDAHASDFYVYVEETYKMLANDRKN
uniref:serine hydrolase domain-containing protein n=1 Tax=Flavobacterium sp. TaxID=239 RepID=UPI00404A65D0